MPHQVFDSPLFGVTVNEYPSRLPYPTPELPALIALYAKYISVFHTIFRTAFYTFCHILFSIILYNIMRNIIKIIKKVTFLIITN